MIRNVLFRNFKPTYIGSGGTYLHTWLDAADISTVTKDSSNLVSAWANKGLGAVTGATASGAVRPVYTASNADGDPAILGDGTKNMTLGSAVSDYNFLHNGNGGYIMLVCRSRATAATGLIANRSSSNQIGYGITTQSTNRLNHVCGNGSANVFSETSQNNTYRSGTFIVESQFQDALSPQERTLFWDGVPYLGGTSATAPSTSNATTVMKLLSLGNDNGKSDSDLMEVLIFQGVPTAEEKIALRKYVRAKWRGLDAVANLVVEAGQSNQVSSDTIANSNYSLNDVIDNAYIYDRNDFTGVLDTFYPLTVGVNNVTGTTNGTLFSTNITLAETIATALGNCFLIKYAEGSTDLVTDWNSDPAGPQWTALQTRINEAIPQLITAGYGINFLGVSWHQGESDSQLLADANAYQANQVKFNAAIRANANIPASALIVMMGLKTSDTGTYPYIATINTAKQAVAASDSRSVYITTDDLTLVDGIHLDSASLETLGERIAAAML